MQQIQTLVVWYRNLRRLQVIYFVYEESLNKELGLRFVDRNGGEILAI